MAGKVKGNGDRRLRRSYIKARAENMKLHKEIEQLKEEIGELNTQREFLTSVGRTESYY